MKRRNIKLNWKLKRLKQRLLTKRETQSSSKRRPMLLQLNWNNRSLKKNCKRRISLLNRRFRLFEMLAKTKWKLKSKRCVLRVKDFFKNMRLIEQQLKLQGQLLQSKKLWNKPWLKKCSLHLRELKPTKREEKERPKREKLRRWKSRRLLNKKKQDKRKLRKQKNSNLKDLLISLRQRRQEKKKWNKQEKKKRLNLKLPTKLLERSKEILKIDNCKHLELKLLLQQRLISKRHRNWLVNYQMNWNKPERTDRKFLMRREIWYLWSNSKRINSNNFLKILKKPKKNFKLQRIFWLKRRNMLLNLRSKLKNLSPRWRPRLKKLKQLHKPRLIKMSKNIKKLNKREKLLPKQKENWMKRLTRLN